jgi:hypothetical protein
MRHNGWRGMYHGELLMCDAKGESSWIRDVDGVGRMKLLGEADAMERASSYQFGAEAASRGLPGSGDLLSRSQHGRS